ncbi:unnamed protein product [Vicia faba]|uniref:Uncharacterized protein n=1 Tax=Vicia faba TaxID=3906 RepID=A0AAV1AA53_VICFA|nr:unnamed protein product [Vicia faba]
MLLTLCFANLYMPRGIDRLNPLQAYLPNPASKSCHRARLGLGAVCIALIGSGTDDLTILVFSSKPCWMTQSSCAPSFQYPFAVFVTARSDSGEGKQGTDYTSKTCPEEEEGKLKESNSSSILTDIDGTRPTFLGRSYRTHILPVKGRSGKTLICSSHPYRTLYRESVKEYETFAEGNQPEIDALQHNLGLGLASSKKEKASAVTPFPNALTKPPTAVIPQRPDKAHLSNSGRFSATSEPRLRKKEYIPHVCTGLWALASPFPVVAYHFKKLKAYHRSDSSMSNSLPVEIYGSELDSNCEKEELNSDCDGDCLIRMENRSTPLVVRGEPGGEWEKSFSSPSFHSYLVPRIPSPLRTTTQDCWITHQCHQLKIMALGKPMLTWLTLTPRGKGFFMAFPAYEVLN